MNKEELEVTDLSEEVETEKSVEVNEAETPVETTDEVNETETPVEKKQKLDIRRMILVLIGVICIGVAAYGLYGIYMEYKIAEDRYNDLENEFVQVNTPDDGETEAEPKGPWYELALVDIAGIQSQYPDVIGWMFFEDGSISYPVLKGVDNDQYLYTTYDGKEAKTGSIFMEVTNSSDFSDTHTIIYGHNMRNLSMFGRLKYYKTKEGYYDGREYFQIFRGDEILRYQIFSYQEVEVTSYVYQEQFTSARVLYSRLMERSMINPGLTVEDDDKIITLSTCTADDDHRFVVSAVLVEKYSLTENALIED